jgi:enoyl-CoA hydratase
VRQARQLDLAATLAEDYRLACRFLEGHDFYEGVRAALVDRDHAPRWQPGRLADVGNAEIDAYFAPLDTGELQLSPRAEMQAVR